MSASPCLTLSDGFSASLWFNVSLSSVTDQTTSIVKPVAAYAGLFGVYFVGTQLYLEVVGVKTVIALTITSTGWRNLAFSWNPHSSQLDVYINGISVSTTAASPILTWSSLLGSTLVFGALGTTTNRLYTPNKLVLRDFVVWCRPFFAVDVHKFLGITGMIQILQVSMVLKYYT